MDRPCSESSSRFSLLVATWTSMLLCQDTMLDGVLKLFTSILIPNPIFCAHKTHPQFKNDLTTNKRKCSAQILWKESNFTNLKLKLQIILIQPIEIALSCDNFTFKWANTSCHPPSPSLAMDFGNSPRCKMGEMPWNTMDFVKSLGFSIHPYASQTVCPTLCIWMMLCYFCTIILFLVYFWWDCVCVCVLG